MKNIMKSMLTIGLSLSLFTPLANTVFGQSDNLVERLRNPTQLQTEAKKFDTAIAKLRPLASKTTYTEQDIATVDAFIAEKDGRWQIAYRAQSKAFVAAQKVKTFEDAVRKAAGKDPEEFIKKLEENPTLVSQLTGAKEAGQAFSSSVRGDALLLKTISERMKSQSKKPISLNYFDQSSPFSFVKASFGPKEQTDCQTYKESFLDTSFSPIKNEADFRLQTGVIEAALISLAAAYLGVQVTRLTTGAIGRCIERALSEHTQCIRDERADGGGLTLGERLFCRAEFLGLAYLCIILPF